MFLFNYIIYVFLLHPRIDSAFHSDCQGAAPHATGRGAEDQPGGLHLEHSTGEARLQHGALVQGHRLGTIALTRALATTAAVMGWQGGEVPQGFLCTLLLLLHVAGELLEPGVRGVPLLAAPQQSEQNRSIGTKPRWRWDKRLKGTGICFILFALFDRRIRCGLFGLKRSRGGHIGRRKADRVFPGRRKPAENNTAR